MNSTASDIRRGVRNPRSSSILGLMGINEPVGNAGPGQASNRMRLSRHIWQKDCNPY